MKSLTRLLLTMLLVSPAAASELRLAVDLSDRAIVAMVGEEIIQRYDVAIGKDENPTPAGSFKIAKVIFNPTWVPPAEKWAKGKTAKPAGHPENPMKRVKMFFREPDYYIHGTGDEDSLGKAASHGCIRMSPQDVTALSKLVMEHGGKPMPEPWYRRVLRSRSTKVVFLQKPVPVTIDE